MNNRMMGTIVWQLTFITIVISITIVQPGWCMDADDAPDEVTIDSLASLYGAVTFDHAAHLDMAECAECHHHTTGTGPASQACGKCHPGSQEGDTVACSECHDARPFLQASLKKLEDPTLFHIDKPGLKGAYHLNCLGCHYAMDGPTDCQDCHLMTEKGQKRFNTGKFTPQEFIVKTEQGNAAQQKQ